MSQLNAHEEQLCILLDKLKGTIGGDGYKVACEEVQDYFTERARNVEPFDYLSWNVVTNGQITDPDWFANVATIDEIDRALLAYWRKSRFVGGQWNILFKENSIAQIIIKRLMEVVRNDKE